MNYFNLFLLFYLQAIEEDGTQKISLEVGTYFIKKLRELQSEFDIIGDVRGKGLMIGVELVADRVRYKWQSTKK